jgi:hypothetical protein
MMETLTQDSIQKARQWFAANSQVCIDEVQNGAVRVNYPEKYFAKCRQNIVDALEGRYDNTFAFWQRAYCIQTGECIPLFSK